MHFFPRIVYLENTETVDPNERCITCHNDSTVPALQSEWNVPNYSSDQVDSLGKEIYPSSKTPRPALGPTHPFQWVPKVFSTGKA